MVGTLVRFKKKGEITMLDFKVETVKLEKVAKLLGATPKKIQAMIRNGTLPIGGTTDTVKDLNGNIIERAVTIIPVSRLEAWINAEDLKYRRHTK